MSGETEPFDGLELERYYVSLGATFERQSGSHRHYRLPDGRRLPSTIGTVTSAMMREAARTLGIDYRELRARMGRPITQTGKSKYKPPPRVKVRPVTKEQVMRAISDARKELNLCESSLGNGQRDPSVYRRAWEPISDAVKLLRTAGRFVTNPSEKGDAA